MSGEPPQRLEIEVKFYVENLARLRERLLAAGATQVKPRLFERNVRLDDDRGTLARRRQLLRLRQDDKARLTFKGRATGDAASQAKVREELEVAVSDAITMATILQRLGFQPRQVYEKYRETFVLDGVEIVLDELPYGNFVELEGEAPGKPDDQEAGIRRLAQRLGFDWEQRIVDNYLSLMSQLKYHYDLPFNDLTFDNFDGVEAPIRPILDQK
ncbi:MAG TPA: class IV adenylate cyclase [Candidatus Sulfomarinibacteraceae bacterium]|nr:class IV adenylate cyclase [Candidatus Sulfomarinibacteraceae bacterium]